MIYQFRFSKNNATALALLEMTDSIYENLDRPNGNCCSGI
jgi:hypothetical protein